jgi:hypothetical protein
MLNLALLIFAIAAVGGLILAIQHFRGGPRPWLLAILHGLGGAAGLVLLLLAVLKTEAPAQAKAALALFLVAALGGFLLFAKRLQGKGLPSPVVIIHGAVAVIAFLTLVLAVL